MDNIITNTHGTALRKINKSAWESSFSTKSLIIVHIVPLAPKLFFKIRRLKNTPRNYEFFHKLGEKWR